jgi:hypothetical protein
MALVRIDGPAGAALQQEVDSVEHEWETVCKAPCLAHLSPAFQYRVSGAGLRPSQGFSLRVDEGEAEELHVNKAFLGLYVLGWVGVGAGSGVAGTGLIFDLWSAAANSLSLPPLTRNQALGWILLGGGAAGIVGGLVLVLTNKHTTVSQDVLGQPKAQEQDAAPPPQTPGPAPIETAADFLRTAPVFEVPIVSLSF